MKFAVIISLVDGPEFIMRRLSDEAELYRLCIAQYKARRHFPVMYIITHVEVIRS
jgi:hypothetical protein